MRLLWISLCQDPLVRMGTEGEEEENDGNRQDEIPQACVKEVQEWIPVRFLLAFTSLLIPVLLIYV